MKKNNIFRISIAACFMALCLFQSCSSDDNNSFVAGDVTELQKNITIGYDSISVAKPENFQDVDINEFKKKLDIMTSVITKGEVSAQEVINMNVQFDQAFDKFLRSRMYGIPDSVLIAGFDFQKETNDIIESSGQGKLIATLNAGAAGVFGSKAGFPQFKSEGINGKSIYLNNGAYLAINQYNPNLFLGKQLSIAVWVKPDVIKSGNYIASLNDWNNWKFQLQDQAKAFFTVSTTAGITDSDNERDLTAPTKTWTHLVVVLDLGTSKPLKFYTNGVLTKQWETTQKPALSGTQSALGAQVPLLIGAGVVYEDSWGEISPMSWNYFQGALDEIKFYNAAVTDGQVKWLYNKEAALLESH